MSVLLDLSSYILDFPIPITAEFNTSITPLTGGCERAVENWRFPKRSMSLKLDLQTRQDIFPLYQFYQARRGAAYSFLVYDPNPEAIYIPRTDQFVGRGDGVTTIFDLPGKSSSAQTLYVNSVPTAATILTGGGDANADRAQFAQPPALGAMITTDFTGILRLNMRFAEDKLTIELFEVKLYRTGLSLVERKLA